MKKILAIFSLLAMFSVAAIAQDPPKNTVKKKNAVKTVSPNKLAGKKAVKAKVPVAKMNSTK